MIEVPSWQALMDGMDRVADILKDHGLICSRALHKSSGSSSPDGGLDDLDDRAPPSIDAIITLLGQTPNPSSDRGDYIGLAAAVTGAACAWVKLNRPMTYAEDEALADAWATWASSWQAPPGKTAWSFEEERAKFKTDLGKAKDPETGDGFFSGWRQALLKAVRFGAPAKVIADAKYEQACGQFPADLVLTLQPGETADQAMARMIPSPNCPNGPLILRGGPFDMAQVFVKLRHMVGEERAIIHQGGEFQIWDGTRYRDESVYSINAELYPFIKSANQNAGGVAPITPKRQIIEEVVHALRAYVNVPDGTDMPGWLNPKHAPFPAKEVVACKNTLLHVPTMTTVPHTPNFYSSASLGYAYDPDAPEPKQWLKFLSEVWPTDRECINTLQEAFGLLLTGETKYQRIPYLLGEPGTGRGTIARVLTALVGEHNVASPSFASLARGNFPQPLLGKSVALMADVRYIHREHADAVPLLLSISGEDRLDVNRKNKSVVSNVQLSARFASISNEIAAIPDPTGALKRRFLFIPVEADPKHEAEKDPGLTEKLLTELPGILNWALEVLQAAEGSRALHHP